MGRVKSKVFISAAAAAGLVSGAGYLTFYEVMGRNAKLASRLGALFVKPSAPKAPDEEYEAKRVWFDAQTPEEFEITNVKGQRLHAYLIKADTPSNVYVFGSHGYRNHGKGEFRYMAKYYHDKGFNFFFVDHPAAGLSEGKFIGFGCNESRDALTWLGFMKDTFGDDIQIILHGVSMGSATVMLMSGNDALPDNVKFTVADCGYTSAWDEFDYNLKNLRVPSKPVLSLTNAFNRAIQGFDIKDGTDALSSVRRARVPMLFIHGGSDAFVPTYMGHELYEACSSEDKALLIVEGAEHAESYKLDSAAYEKSVEAFVDKYISVTQTV